MNHSDPLVGRSSDLNIIIFPNLPGRRPVVMKQLEKLRQYGSRTARDSHPIPYYRESPKSHRDQQLIRKNAITHVFYCQAGQKTVNKLIIFKDLWRQSWSKKIMAPSQVVPRVSTPNRIMVARTAAERRASVRLPKSRRAIK